MLNQEALTNAVEAGVIPGMRLVPFPDDWKRPGIDPGIVELAELLPHSPPIKPFKPERQWVDPGRDTRAQLYQDKWFVHDTFQNGYAYELARFQAGIDQVGIVKYCNTFVDVLDGPGGSPIEPDSWDPFWIENNQLDVEFLLTLSQGTPNTIGSAPYVGTYAGILGYGYGQLPRWSDYRFNWGRTHRVWWLVPRRHALRLYMRVISRADLCGKAMGRMWGYTQPTSTLQAEWNVAHGW